MIYLFAGGRSRFYPQSMNHVTSHKFNTFIVLTLDAPQLAATLLPKLSTLDQKLTLA